MSTAWPVGLLVATYAVVATVGWLRDLGRDLDPPYRVRPMPPEPGDQVVIRGGLRVGWTSLGIRMAGRMTITQDWIAVRSPVLRGGQVYLAAREDVVQVHVLRNLLPGTGIGLEGARGRSGVVLWTRDRERVEAGLDRFAWPRPA